MKKNMLPGLLLVLAPMALVSCTGKSASSSATDPVDENAVYTATLNPCNGDEQYLKEHVLSGKHGVSQALPKKGNGIVPTKEGYNFVGWSTHYDKNSGMGDKNYRDEDNVITFDNKNLVLYAIYAKTGISEELATAELAKWVANSQPNHLYYHYYRFGKTVADYADWDVWAWPYAPTAGEGTKFDWVGRTQDPAHKEQQATGDATLDEYAGACIDIDLKGSYTGGWDNDTKKITNVPVSFADSTKIGLQIVKTSTRTGTGKFWTNDGSNLYIDLKDYAVDVNGGKAYHVFVVQDNVQSPSALPTGEKDPFEDDDGTNTTYGNGKYDNVAWNKKTDMVKTSKDFSDVGVGYQIMVSSFADSDGDGFGDIYGITQKLDYLQKLGVKALWLTPIQLSDSYHGYDITDYEKVDPKFGSSLSPAGQANGGNVDSDTAMADYKELIEQAHSRGMKIVMDLVLNHTSTSNAWFVKSANLDEHFRGYYQWGSTGTGDIIESNNWYPYGSHPYSFYAKFGSSMPELNFSYVDTRVAVEEMSVFWARDIGVDGFRLDAIKHIFMENEVSSTDGDTIIKDISASGDYSSDLSKNLQFFRELKTIVTTCSGKDVFFVGENFDGHAYQVSPYYEAFDSLFDFYSYFNLTSAAATGRKNTTSAFGTAAGFMNNTSLFNASSEANIQDTAGIYSKANGSAWNFPGVYATYNKYREDISLPGLFTSNHDIARVINRIAGGGTAEGLQYQGRITTASDYASFEQSADCVKIAELMMPGLTWIYYGDEIGMTGNFPAGYNPADVANIPYADLWYRQPMKWVANGQKGDDAGTTDYYVTGSSMKVEQDDMNKSSAVKPALEQMNDPNSEYSILKKFVDLKAGSDDVGKALRLGSISTGTYFASGDLAANVLCFERKLNGVTVKVAVNFNNQTMSAYGLSGTVLASYRGATASSLPAYSAIVVKA